MAKRKEKQISSSSTPSLAGYDSFLGDISDFLEQSRRAAARSVNAVMTLTYWEVGRRIVEFEQAGEKRAEYGKTLLRTLSADLKIGKFTQADAGQMHMYLHYARENWTRPDENPPVGLILCASKGSMLAKYALEGLSNEGNCSRVSNRAAG